MIKPLISIVIPVYNNQKYIQRAVDSVLYQSMKSWELVIVDDGSTDGTGLLADEIASRDDRIKVIHQDNQWIYASMNNGVKESIGEYVYILNSDDSIVDNGLLILENKLKQYDYPDVIWTDIIQCSCDENGKILREQPVAGINSEEYYSQNLKLLKSWKYINDMCLISNQANLYKRELVVDNPFRNDVYGADYLFNINILDKVKTSVVISKPIYKFYIQEKNANTSLKYWPYEHDMFNEFYIETRKLLSKYGLLEESDKSIAETRVRNLFVEYNKLFANNCDLTTDEKLNKIYRDYFDETVIEAVEKSDNYEMVERTILRICRKMIDTDESKNISKLSFVPELIKHLTPEQVTEDLVEKLEIAVNDKNNPMKIGKTYLKYVKERAKTTIPKKTANAKKVLWLCDIVLPEISDQLLFRRTENSKWFNELWNRMKRIDYIDFAICVPIKNAEYCRDGKIDNYRYYSVIENMDEGKVPDMKNRFETIINDFRPDVIHVFGGNNMISRLIGIEGAKYGLKNKIMTDFQNKSLTIFYGEDNDFIEEYIDLIKDYK